MPLTSYMCRSVFFFFNDTATTEIYTLSLHDALPIYRCIRSSTAITDDRQRRDPRRAAEINAGDRSPSMFGSDLKHAWRSEEHTSELQSNISYAVFCLKKKKRSSRSKTQDLTIRAYIS